MKENNNLTIDERDRILKTARIKNRNSKNTLYVHDIENSIGYLNQKYRTEDHIFKKQLSNLDQALDVSNSDLAIISGNMNLINRTNRIYYQKTPCQEIMIPASGKNGADLKLIQTIEILNKENLLDNFSNIVLISGDKIFYEHANSLKNKGFAVETYSRSESTAKEFIDLKGHKYINHCFKTGINKKNKSKKYKKLSSDAAFQKLIDKVVLQTGI